MSTDSTFITNQEKNILSERITEILSHSSSFDCLVGYFYISGFYELQDSLKSVDKIRILIGMNTDATTVKMLKRSKNEENIPSSDVKNNVKSSIITEMNESDDNILVEKGANNFLEWLKSGKIEIRAYKDQNIHAKLYVMTLDETQMDVGRVITGSSNLTQAGLNYNIEFNVELKTSQDYEFAKNKFNELWENSVEVTDDYVSTLPKDTWLNSDITPYELYLKFIYEYYYEKIDNDKISLMDSYKPEEFKDLKYQKDAVLEAKSIIDEYGGVFLSDVVGLGKTYMGALLAQQLKGRTLVIAPPVLIDEKNPGGWKQIMNRFQVNADCESIGKLDHVLKSELRYENIIIDESHKFRNRKTQRYDLINEICAGKNVVLISATPYNNYPDDLLNQILLFQDGHKSTLPNPKVRDLKKYFRGLNKQSKEYDKKENTDKFIENNKLIAQDIRENVLKYLMVRRTRSDIIKYYAEDLKVNNMEFPTVHQPQSVYYEFSEKQDKIFNESLEIITDKLTYAKYMPLSVKYAVEYDEQYGIAQNNFGNFIKISLIKRLESSIDAFRKSIDRYVDTHKKVIKLLEDRGEFYTSQNYSTQIVDFISDDVLNDTNEDTVEAYNLISEENLNKINDLIEREKVKRYTIDDFKPTFIEDLRHDLRLFEIIQQMWKPISFYPKNMELVKLINTKLKGKKIIIFTEFIDTANYIYQIIKDNCTGKVYKFTGDSNKDEREIVIQNFDANVKEEYQKNDYNILITTDILSHGVNLHRANTIINYDIPWNPTKIMQRVGRVQRLDTKFEDIYTYNFFPTAPIEENINLETLAENKIAMFIELLGNDSALLTEEPIGSKDLFRKLNSNPELTDDESEDPELKYLSLIRDIRDHDPELYRKIENMPFKSRVVINSDENALITLLQSGRFKKIFKTTANETIELDFNQAIMEFNKDKETKSLPVNERYYDYLIENITAFNNLIKEEKVIEMSRSEKDLMKTINFTLKSYKSVIDKNDQQYFRNILKLIKKGTIPQSKINQINEDIKIKNKKDKSFIRYLQTALKQNISENIELKGLKEDKNENTGTRVILSQYSVK